MPIYKGYLAFYFKGYGIFGTPPIQASVMRQKCFLAYRIGISAIFTHVRNFYLTPLARAVPALGKDKKRTDARSAELLLPGLLLVVNVNNIRFSSISAKHFDHQENKQTKIILLEFQICRLFFT